MKGIFDNMNTEIALLQVHLSRYKPGDKISRDDANSKTWWSKSWQYTVKPVRTDEARIWEGDLFEFAEFATAIGLEAFGEGHDLGYSCGLAAELEHSGLIDVFSGEGTQRIIDLGESGLVKVDDFGRHAHYILAVECKWWKSEETWQGGGEYDASFEVMGRVDLSGLKLIKEAEPEKEPAELPEDQVMSKLGAPKLPGFDK